MTTLRQLHNALRQADPNWTPGDDSYDAALVLLASAVVGPNADKIASFTRLPRSKVREIGKRCRDNGVWRGSTVRGDWEDGVGFFCDVNVALGFLVRTETAGAPSPAS